MKLPPAPDLMPTSSYSCPAVHKIMFICSTPQACVPLQILFLPTTGAQSPVHLQKLLRISRSSQALFFHPNPTPTILRPTSPCFFPVLHECQLLSLTHKLLLLSRSLKVPASVQHPISSCSCPEPHKPLIPFNQQYNHTWSFLEPSFAIHMAINSSPGLTFTFLWTTCSRWCLETHKHVLLSRKAHQILFCTVGNKAASAPCVRNETLC